MKQTKKYISVLCAAAVLLLCSVNLTYAWQNFGQTALNVNMGGEAPDTPTDPDKPDTPDDDKPKPPDTDKPKPPSDSKPENPDDKKDPGSTGGSSGTQKPSDGQTSGSSGTQNGKNDAKTGDSAEYVKYLALMLLSFAALIIVGVFLIILLINEIEKRRK